MPPTHLVNLLLILKQSRAGTSEDQGIPLARGQALKVALSLLVWEQVHEYWWQDAARSCACLVCYDLEIIYIMLGLLWLHVRSCCLLLRQ